MTKIIVIPDVHGTREWARVKDIVDNYDYVIALGDWFDNYKNQWGEVDQIENLRDFIEFKNRYSSKVFSCLGNHDFHYLFNYYGEKYSGYQEHKAWDIHQFLEENCDQFKVAAMVDKVVFSHAGVSAAWMKNKGYSTFEEMNFDIVNQDVTMRGDRFQDLCFYRNGLYDNYGNEPTQTPVWIRPEALWGVDGSNMFFPYQVIGHTCYRDQYAPFLRENISIGKWLLCCDNEKHRLIDITIDDGILVEYNKVV